MLDIIVLLPRIKPKWKGVGRAPGHGRLPPVGGLERCWGHSSRDEASAAGHSAPSPPARTTSGPRRSGLRAARQPGRSATAASPVGPEVLAEFLAFLSAWPRGELGFWKGARPRRLILNAAATVGTRKKKDKT